MNDEGENGMERDGMTRARARAQTSRTCGLINHRSNAAFAAVWEHEREEREGRCTTLARCLW
jgi:hypothetical protein